MRQEDIRTSCNRGVPSIRRGAALLSLPLHNVQRDAPYTLEEKQWRNVYCGGEFRFLQAHGLSVHKDDDREGGRAITRALMADEGSEGRNLVDALSESDDEGDSMPNEDHSGSDSES